MGDSYKVKNKRNYRAFMLLSSSEIERYARHIVLRGIGGSGQKKLKAAKVLVIGAGGLGCPLLQYLVAAGVGEIGIVDDDVVSLSNLQRQVLFTTDDVGKLKVECAARVLNALNASVKIVSHNVRLTEENARELVRGYDLVADGSDNFATRYVVSDACFYEGKPLVTAAVAQFDASLTTIRAHEKRSDGVPNPTYRCLFPGPPPEGSQPICATAGIVGALTGIIGAMMALEVIREIVGGFGGDDEGLVGKLLLMDCMSLRFETIKYGWDSENVLSGIGSCGRFT
jgi:molybdopterin-synthase adenylyltransferase